MCVLLVLLITLLSVVPLPYALLRAVASPLLLRVADAIKLYSALFCSR